MVFSASKFLTISIHSFVQKRGRVKTYAFEFSVRVIEISLRLVYYRFCLPSLLVRCFGPLSLSQEIHSTVAVVAIVLLTFR